MLHCQVMLLEPEAGEKPLIWPVVFQGKPRYDSDPRGVSVWPIARQKLLPALRVAQGDDAPQQVQTLLGAPGNFVQQLCWLQSRLSYQLWSFFMLFI